MKVPFSSAATGPLAVSPHPMIVLSPLPSMRRILSTAVRDHGNCAPTRAQAMPSRMSALARSRTSRGTSLSVKLASQSHSRPVGPWPSVGGSLEPLNATLVAISTFLAHRQCAVARVRHHGLRECRFSPPAPRRPRDGTSRRSALRVRWSTIAHRLGVFGPLNGDAAAHTRRGGIPWIGRLLREAALSGAARWRGSTPPSPTRRAKMQCPCVLASGCHLAALSSEHNVEVDKKLYATAARTVHLRLHPAGERRGTPARRLRGLTALREETRQCCLRALRCRSVHGGRDRT
jgi:hypothetical protein